MDRCKFIGLSAGVAASAMLGGCKQLASLGAKADVLGAHDATGLAQMVKAGDVKPVELVEAAIARIEAANGALNAVTHKAYDRAREAALAFSPDQQGAFSGVPYLLKCLEGEKGEPQTFAARFFKDNIAQDSEPVTGRIDEAGAIYLGQTNAPEFGSSVSTEPALYGATHNPWNLDYSPGASSGGSGAAVSAGLTPFATADDGGGSTRIPASACGIVGMKYTRAREVGHEESFTTNTGIHSRSIRDIAAGLNVIERKDNPELPAVGMVDPENPGKLKIAMTTVGIKDYIKTDPEVADSTRAAGKLLEDLGHEVKEVRFETDGDEFWANFWAVWSSGFDDAFTAVREKFGREPDERDFERWTLTIGGLYGNRFTAEDVEKGLAYFAAMRARHRAFLQEYDIALSPTLPQQPTKLGVYDTSSERAGDFDVFSAMLADYINFTPLNNVTGTPSISLPLAWSSTGLPMGTLLSADVGEEAKLLRLSYQIEEARPWADKFPPHGAWRV